MANFDDIIDRLKAVTADLEEAASEVALGTYTVGEPPAGDPEPKPDKPGKS